MSQVLDILLTVIVFLLILTVIVVVHEGGHAWVARRCGARVTEFFVGMPWGPEATRTSKRTGITYGATFALLGGYTRISGMTPLEDGRASLSLALVNARGRVSDEELARVLDTDVEDAQAILVLLEDWGSVRGVRGTGRARSRREAPHVFETVERDAHGLTVFDGGHDFSLPGSTCAGEPFAPDMDADAFLEAERSHTYQGLGFFRRIVVLVAGVAMNIVLAFAVFMLYFMLHGVTYVEPGVAGVSEGSVAEASGMVAGDEVVRVGGSDVDGYYGLSAALSAVRGTGPFELVYMHDGTEVSVEAELGEGEALGVTFRQGMIRLTLPEAATVTVAYIGEVAQAVASLLVPSETAEVLQESSGVVGIAVLTEDAVTSGVWEVLLLLGMLSLSLGWMNLLPIPPLDGGKVAIELVELVIRRPVPLSVQGIANIVGIALLCALFVFMVIQDALRIAGVW